MLTTFMGHFNIHLSPRLTKIVIWPIFIVMALIKITEMGVAVGSVMRRCRTARVPGDKQTVGNNQPSTIAGCLSA